MDQHQRDVPITPRLQLEALSLRSQTAIGLVDYRQQRYIPLEYSVGISYGQSATVPELHCNVASKPGLHHTKSIIASNKNTQAPKIPRTPVR